MLYRLILIGDQIYGVSVVYHRYVLSKKNWNWNFHRFSFPFEDLSELKQAIKFLFSFPFRGSFFFEINSFFEKLDCTKISGRIYTDFLRSRGNRGSIGTEP